MIGEYFANNNLSGIASFTREDVRIDFDWGDKISAGGSIGEPYKSFPKENFSIRWTGNIISRYSETYTFRGYSDGVRVIVNGKTIIDNWSSAAKEPSWTSQGAIALTAGQKYDIKIEYRHLTGNAAAKVLWSSPSIPEEVIDPLVENAVNIDDFSACFTDIVKCARNTWQNTTMDVNGWPMGDGEYIFQESLNQGLDIDPLMQGTITFSFKGKADVSIEGNCDRNSVKYTYNKVLNITTGTFKTMANTWNASYFIFNNSHRDGLANGPGGITDLKLMRPIAPNATSSFSEDIIINPVAKEAFSHFTVFRVNLNNGNLEKEWTDRTLPTFFNQNGGKEMSFMSPWGKITTTNSTSWEYDIMFCNEVGKDLYINIPMMASGKTVSEKNGYVNKLANLIKYGSDGVNPYTSTQANPVYPPLNPNLRVYIELSNENWNFAGGFYQYGQLGDMLQEDKVASREDYKILTYDNITDEYELRHRKAALRIVQISDIFRSVFGDSKMLSRIRPIYEYQYNNYNNTASQAFDFIDNYFNNADGKNHVSTPHPVNYYLWGGGGATYYGSKNTDGVTDIMQNSSFETPVVSNYLEKPSGTNWTFASKSGIVHNGSSLKNPDALNGLGSQCAYIQGVNGVNGSMSTSITFPSTQISDVYAISFRALNRKKVGATEADTQNLRVYFDGKDITARTFSNGNGYIPPAYNADDPWAAKNVFWSRSNYYATKTVSIVPGSIHTIKIVGTSTSGDQMAFIDDVRVTSTDAIFAAGMPDGGQANGQVTSGTYQYELNGQAIWAKAYGLNYIAYEGGWSLGGDDHGSPLQNNTKYNAPQTRKVQEEVSHMFQKAGGKINAFGTYSQWSSWADIIAKQGLLDVTKYPLIQGIDDTSNKLTSEVTNGTLVPGIIDGNKREQYNELGTYLYFRARYNNKLRYPIRSEKAGKYTISVKAFTLVSATSIDVYLNGNLAGNLALDKTSDQSIPYLESKSINVVLTKGLNVITLAARNETDTNIEYIKVSKPTTYTVRFNSNGGSLVANQNINYNQRVIKPSNPNKVGYTFGGWYKEKDLVNVFSFTNIRITYSRTLYAKWIIKN